MFRELSRKSKQISIEECIELLLNEKRGVLSVNGDNGYPYSMPMNHFYNVQDGCIYFHCGKKGHRLDSLKKSEKVCFCVFEKGIRNESEWAYNVRSVVVFGKIDIIEDTNIINKISYKLSRKFTDDEEYIKNEIDKFGKATLLLKLSPENICGKRVTES